MANSNEQLRGVSWTEVFGFTHIFKSFRMARQPAKIALAMCAVIGIFLAGHIIDSVWNTLGQRVPEGDVIRYVTSSQGDYKDSLRQWKNEDDRLQQAAGLKVKYMREKHSLTMFQGNTRFGGTKFAQVFNSKLDEYNKEHEGNYSPPYISSITDAASKEGSDSSDILSQAGKEFDGALKKIDLLLEPSYDETKSAIEEDELLKQDSDKRKKAVRELKEQYGDAIRAVVKLKVQFKKDKLSIEGRSVFESFVDYEVRFAKESLGSLLRLNMLGGMEDYTRMLSQKAITPQAVGTPSGNIAPPRSGTDRMGFVPSMLMCAHGFMWIIREHTLFMLVFGAVSLAIWALFGGAIHRMAALHAAREEMISIPQALKFAREKFWSYFFAPLLPMGIILFLGCLLGVMGLLANIPGLGAVIIALLVLVALMLSMVMTFMLIGLFAGFGLMYPTIAVEGSDTFDALNRSVSFTFSHPWRTTYYSLVALVGGSVWYLFARTIAFLTLSLAHWFIQVGVIGGGASLSPDADKLDLIWPAPTFSDLHPQCSWAAMSWNEAVGAWIISVWVYLVIAAVAAVMLAYFSSASTMIYYLLRRKVDAADLDEVFVDEADEELFYEDDTQPKDEYQEPQQEQDDDSADEPETQTPQ